MRRAAPTVSRHRGAPQTRALLVGRGPRKGTERNMLRSTCCIRIVAVLQARPAPATRCFARRAPLRQRRPLRAHQSGGCGCLAQRRQRGGREVLNSCNAKFALRMDQVRQRLTKCDSALLRTAALVLELDSVSGDRVVLGLLAAGRYRWRRPYISRRAAETAPGPRIEISSTVHKLLAAEQLLNLRSCSNSF